MAYRSLGEGLPVVFLHGFFGDARVWRQQFELANSYRVIAWDAPGCGGSSQADRLFAMADYAECLGGFIQALHLDRPHLVGNSFGGALALSLAAQHPRIARSLVLVGAYAGWSGSFPPDVVATRLAASLPDLELPKDEVVKKWLPGFVTESAPVELVDELASIIGAFNSEGMRSMILALAEADLRNDLATIAAPTLLIWGDRDVRSPLAVATGLHDHIPGSRLIVLQGAGHLTQMEAASRFNSELRAFLEEIDASN